MSNYKFILLGCFLSLSAPFDDKEPPENIPPKESDYFEPSEKIRNTVGYKGAVRGNKAGMLGEPFSSGFGAFFARYDGKIRHYTKYENYMSGVDE